MKNSKKFPQVEEENFGMIAYRRLADIPGYSPERVNKDFFYIKIENYMNSGRVAYIRCTKEQYQDYRNVERNTQRQEKSYNEHIGNCSEPYYRVIKNANGNETIIEYADPNQLSLEEQVYKDILLQQIIKKVNKERDAKDVIIMNAILAGADTDEVISKIVGLSRSTVQERKQKLIDWLREEFKEENNISQTSGKIKDVLPSK